MKRAFAVLGVIALTALITFLAVTRHLSQERAARLDRALMDAEQRLVELEGEIDAAKQQIAELSKGRAEAASSTRSRAPAAPVPETAAGNVISSQPGQATGAGAGASAPGVAISPGTWIRYVAVASPGLTNVARIEGTSTVHNWQVEGHIIGGSADFGPGFPPEAGVKTNPGPVDAKVSVFIPVRSLKSVERDGSHYSDPMDEIMYGKLLEQTHKRITFTLTSLSLKEQAGEMKAPYVYEAIGNLGVAGRTNAITMQVTVSANSNGKIQFSGSIPVKMTDFGITPPSPSFAGGVIKTGDEVTLKFVWWVNRSGLLEARK
jgi:polyisoprenoid-binding protein YceI